MKSSSLVPAFLLVALLLVVQSAVAEPGYDVTIYSKDYQPGHVVFVNVTGPANMTIVIRIVDGSGLIVSGRDAALDKTGNYSFGWSPSQDGDYNATVQFSTGLSITRKVTIQDKVTSDDVGEIYQSLFRLQYRIEAALKSLSDLVYVAITLSVISLISSAVMFNHMRRRFSPTETDFQKLMRYEIKDVVWQRIKQRPKE